MSTDIDINVGLAIDPSQAKRELSNLARQAQDTLNTYINTALPPSIRAVGALATRLTVLSVAAAGAAEATDKAVELYKKAILQMEKLSAQSNILEDRRIAVLKVQHDYMVKQLAIANRFNAAMNNASLMVEKIDKKYAEAIAKIDANKDQARADIDKRAQNKKNLVQSQIADAQNMASQGSWNWGWSGWAEHSVLTGNSPTGADANRQDFSIGGKKAEVYRNVGLGRYKASGTIIWNGQEFPYSNDEEYRAAFQKIQALIDKTIEDEQEKARAKEEAQAIEAKHQQELQVVKENFERDMAVMYASAAASYETAMANMISNIASAQSTADANSYALRRKLMNEEYQAEIRYIQEVERLRQELGGQELDKETQQRLENLRNAEKAIAQSRNAVETAINSTLRPSSLGGLTGGVEDAARMQQVRDMQKALDDFEERNQWIQTSSKDRGGRKMTDEKRTQYLMESEEQLQQELNAGAVKYAENLQIIASYAADYETRMKSINAQTKQETASLSVQRRHMNEILKIEEKYRQDIKSATSETERQTAEMEKQTALAAERLRLENETLLATEQDNLARMKQSARRNQSETAITASGNIFEADVQAISDFRTKVYQGMRAGTMSGIEFEMAGIEKTYAMRQAREQAMHERRMQFLRDYEAQQEQQINLAYEKQTAADRQRIAELMKLQAAGTITDSQKDDLQNSQKNIEAAEDQRREAMESLRTNPRGSVMADTEFKQRMAIENARHKEQIGFLSAIKDNTGKYVSAMSDSYKQINSQMLSQSQPAVFGADAAQIYPLLKMIAANTAPIKRLQLGYV